MKHKIKEWLPREEELLARGYTVLAGLDEAGCGPLAGPVVAAAVVLKEAKLPPKLDDSKKLTAKSREAVYEQIINQCDYGVGFASHVEIDALNIRQASRLAMERALGNLPYPPEYLLIDGISLPFWQGKQESFIRGDSLIASIAAASVVAKVTRDRYMVEIANTYPEYLFAQHKGYPTPLHYQLLLQFGPSPIHRRSFLKSYYKMIEA
ncbi:MAG: ribonuclease HII [Symbiobacteriaceae bacterium]|nr:ribonuclease HII [Symbiobacteriaceae bacterium]